MQESNLLEPRPLIFKASNYSTHLFGRFESHWSCVLVEFSPNFKVFCRVPLGPPKNKKRPKNGHNLPQAASADLVMPMHHITSFLSQIGLTQMWGENREDFRVERNAGVALQRLVWSIFYFWVIFSLLNPSTWYYLSCLYSYNMSTKILEVLLL